MPGKPPTGRAGDSPVIQTIVFFVLIAIVLFVLVPAFTDWLLARPT